MTITVAVAGVAFNPEHMVEIDYTNYRGERGKRLIVPIIGTSDAMTFEENEWHKPAQWMVRALDVEKGAVRTFAMQGIHGWRELTDREMWKRLREIADRQIDATIDVTKPARPETTEEALARSPYVPTLAQVNRDRKTTARKEMRKRRGYFGNAN